MGQRKTVDRNRKMFEALMDGQEIEKIGADYGLKAVRVRAIINDEKNRIMVCAEPFYRKLRVAARIPDRPSEKDVESPG